MSLGAEQRHYLKFKAAYYYYEKDYTQTEIAKMLGISRNTLGKLLYEAKQEGMVKISIVDSHNMMCFLDLEVRLKDKFGLFDVKVVDSIDDSRAQINRAIAQGGARYVERILDGNMSVGIGWGRTLEQLVDYIRPAGGCSGMEVVTLLGGAGTAQSRIQPNIIANRLLQKYGGGTGYILNAPYVCQTSQLCETLKRDPHIAGVLEKARSTDIALVGIGEPPSAQSCTEMGYEFTELEIKELEQSGAAGDICVCFFDNDGAPCESDINKRVLAVSLDSLRSMRRVIAFAGGAYKLRAIRGALRGGYIDVLVTDRFTAQLLL